jgi:hypothetical protein
MWFSKKGEIGEERREETRRFLGVRRGTANVGS